MIKKVNWFLLMVVAYIVATIFYVFVHVNSEGWGVYHQAIATLLILIVFFGCLKPNKSELDKSLLIAIVLLRIFNFITYLIWYLIGCDFQSTPTFFCVMVMVCLLIGLMLNKKILWKSTS